MIKKLLLSTCISAIALGTLGQAKLVEKVTRKGNEIVIPYEKYVLPNGLTLILHEDHSDPVAHVDITYHVGSAREEIGKSGFAHFFEHMMFEGSDHVKDKQHFKLITEAGGTLNGSTNLDRTNYFETVPSNQLEKMLWLESDRMGFLLNAVTQEKFEIQRATVKNERGQNYDNRPYGLMSEYVSKNLYPYGHPYSWLTIGYIEELNKVGVNDLKNFFLRWYNPNNATLTIAGDINAKQTIAWVEKYFGPIPRGPVAAKMHLPPPVLTADRYVSYTDNYAQLPLLSITYPGVEAYNKDEAALDALAAIIGRGNNSILYQNLVKTRKAVQATMNSRNSELSGEISLTVVPYPGQTLAEMKAGVEQSFKDFEARGVSDEDLKRIKGSSEAQYINGLASVSGKASELALAQTLTGNPNQIQNELKEIDAVTKEDVMRVYNQYVKGKPAVILSVLPKGKEDMRLAADNYTIDKSGYKAPDYGYASLKYNKAVDNFDRSKTPPAGPAVVIKAPAFWTAKTTNGIDMIGTFNNEIPTVSVSLSIKGGGLLMAKDAAKAGLPSITASMLNDATEKYTAEALSSELQKLGSSIVATADDYEMGFRVAALKKNLAPTMALLEERLLHPKFTQDALDRIKKQAIQGLKNAKTQPAFVASSVYDKLLKGTKNISTYAVSGTPETVANITLADVQAFYDNNFSPSVSEVVVVGDITEAEARAKLAFLNGWKTKTVDIPAPAAGNTFSQTKLYLVNVPKAAQSEIRIGYQTNLTYDALGEFYRAGIMDFALGGGFNSRINLNLREDKGWTYGASSRFTGDKYDGSFVAAAGVKAGATDSSVVEFIKEIKNYQQKGITPAELVFTKASISQSDARKYETNAQKAAFLSRIQEYNLKPTFADEQNKVLQGITKAEVDALAAKYLDLNKMIILVVGDKDRILPGLQKLGYDIVELNADGEPLANK
ncbi:zinc protease [Mucilaginibacter gracilis]|uniref:Zinc protease n=1 Tax=Mucilaginibacter gracilis TaxID=423350 RepID=A0A495IX95_9SPHI|nr:pitrilysin family protein [Mucilaginibacter gracilis]RKR81300.1 zinc protease [Mucilaginibacter gracilis]